MLVEVTGPSIGVPVDLYYVGKCLRLFASLQVPVGRDFSLAKAST